MTTAERSGHWIVEVKAPNGEWNSLDGEYLTPSPAAGGTEEQAIEEERISARKVGHEYGEGCLRAEWVEE